MRITYACPACDATVVLDAIESRSTLECPACQGLRSIPSGAFVPEIAAVQGGAGVGAAGKSRLRINHCLICPSAELFVRKDFPQRVGLAIVVAGLMASCVAWANRELILTFSILFATALLDLVLYMFMPDCLSCYRCQSRYSGDGATDNFAGFDLETHEKHRQQLARMQQLAPHPLGDTNPKV